MTQKRTSVRVPAGTSAQRALDEAQKSLTFDRMPAARKRRRGTSGDLDDAARAPRDTDTDLEISMEELFAQDGNHDLVADVGEVADFLADAKTEGERIYEEALAAGVEGVRLHTNGAVWIHGPNGRFKKRLHAPATDEETGRFVKGVEGPVGEPEWYQATDGQELAAKIEERIEALGASLFQKSGGLSPARRGAMVRAFINDRSRRALEDDSWRLPSGVEEALRAWAESET